MSAPREQGRFEDGMGHVWTEQSDLDRLDELEDVVVPSLRADNERLREAITDALADLTPGYSPYSLLEDALRASEASSEPRP